MGNNKATDGHGQRRYATRQRSDKELTLNITPHRRRNTYKETTEGQHEVSFGMVYERLSRTYNSDAQDVGSKSEHAFCKTVASTQDANVKFKSERIRSQVARDLGC